MKMNVYEMIFEAVREGIGEDMIIEFRMSAEDGVEGGMTIDDMVEFCREIDRMVDIIHVSNGLKWAGNQTQTLKRANIPKRTVEREIKNLRESGRITRKGGRRYGYWEVM